MTYNDALEFEYEVQYDTAQWQYEQLSEAVEDLRSAINLLTASDTQTEYDHIGALTEIMGYAIDECDKLQKFLADEDERDREAISREYERST